MSRPGQSPPPTTGTRSLDRGGTRRSERGGGAFEGANAGKTAGRIGGKIDSARLLERGPGERHRDVGLFVDELARPGAVVDLVAEPLEQAARRSVGGDDGDVDPRQPERF